jgi:hypothetical protein
MYYKRMLEKIVSYLGLKLETGIAELDDEVYVPSSPNSALDTTTGLSLFSNLKPPLTQGIPNPDDFGYSFADFFALIESRYNAKFRVVNGDTMVVRTEKDPYWKKQSQYIQRGVADIDTNAQDQKSEEEVFNITEYVAATLVAYETDSNDPWTLINRKGTFFEVSEKVSNPKDKRLVKEGGLREIRFPVALGNRKSELSDVEKAVDNFFKLITLPVKAIQALGFMTSLNLDALDISRRIGAMRIGGKTYKVPKVVLLKNGKIPANHRDILNAEQAWNKFWNEKSFIENNFRNQKQLFNSEQIPLNGVEFAQIIDSSVFTKYTGESGEMETLEWIPDRSLSVQTNWVRKRHMKGLTQKGFTPE